MSLEIKEVIQLARKQFVELLPDLAITPASPTPKKGVLPPQILADMRMEQLGANVRLEELEKDRRGLMSSISRIFGACGWNDRR